MKTMVRKVGFVGTLGALVLLAIAMLLLMAAAPARAAAQDARLTRLPEPARGQVEALVAAGRERGLPIEALIDRALEGAAKGASPALIVTAVTRLSQELNTARDALGSGAVAAEITAGASALRAGATSDDLTRLKDLRGRQRLTVAAGVLADLVSVGVPVDTAISAVLQLATDAEDADYLAFQRNVQRDIALGAAPVAALEVRLRNAHPGLQADAPNGGGVTVRPKRKP